MQAYIVQFPGERVLQWIKIKSSRRIKQE
jgi:hypothetical protein